MISSKSVHAMVSALDGVTVKDHFGSDAFSANKRIFVTVWHDKGEVNFRFSPEQQKYFLESNADAFSELDNAWGKQGWTRVHLEYIGKSEFQEALKAAWETSAIKNTAQKKSSGKKTTVIRESPLKVGVPKRDKVRPKKPAGLSKAKTAKKKKAKK